MSATPTPYNNIVTLLEHIAKNKAKRDMLVKQIEEIPVTLDNIDKIDKLEEELEFLNSYSKTLMDQSVVIMNENDVTGLPSLYDLEKKAMLMAPEEPKLLTDTR